jgi:hypothetical protein
MDTIQNLSDLQVLFGLNSDPSEPVLLVGHNK